MFFSFSNGKFNLIVNLFNVSLDLDLLSSSYTFIKTVNTSIAPMLMETGNKLKEKPTWLLKALKWEPWHHHFYPHQTIQWPPPPTHPPLLGQYNTSPLKEQEDLNIPETLPTTLYEWDWIPLLQGYFIFPFFRLSVCGHNASFLLSTIIKIQTYQSFIYSENRFHIYCS